MVTNNSNEKHIKLWTPVTYRIEVDGHLAESWSDRLAAMRTFDNTHYVAADLIWTPYKPVTLGVEYLWGRRENKDGASGTDNRYLFSSRYDF